MPWDVTSFAVYQSLLMAMMDCAPLVRLSAVTCLSEYTCSPVAFFSSLCTYFRTVPMLAILVLMGQAWLVWCILTSRGAIRLLSDEEGDVAQRRKNVHDKLVNEVLVELSFGLAGDYCLSVVNYTTCRRPCPSGKASTSERSFWCLVLK